MNIATPMAKLKDNFKNFEEKFKDSILDKKELTSSLFGSSQWNRKVENNVENDFIRVYTLKNDTSLGFGFNNIKKESFSYSSFYENLFDRSVKMSSEHESIKDYIEKDLDGLISCSKSLYSNDKEAMSYIDRGRSREFNENHAKNIAHSFMVEELITITFYDENKEVFSNTMNFEDFKNTFKKFSKESNELSQNTLISCFLLKQENQRTNNKLSAFDEFKEAHLEDINKYVFLKNDAENKKQDFNEVSKICNKLIEEFTSKIYKEYDFEKKSNDYHESKNKLNEKEKQLFNGSSYNKTAIENFYPKSEARHGLGLNLYKKTISTELQSLSIPLENKKDIDAGELALDKLLNNFNKNKEDASEISDAPNIRNRNRNK